MCMESLNKNQPQTKQAWGFLVGFFFFYHQTEGLKEQRKWMDTNVSKYLILPKSKCRQINAHKGISFLSPMDFFFSATFLCELEMKTIHPVPQRRALLNGITV